eukprot:855459-Pyramimonas_sp.AAC.1
MALLRHGKDPRQIAMCTAALGRYTNDASSFDPADFFGPGSEGTANQQRWIAWSHAFACATEMERDDFAYLTEKLAC